MDLFMAYMQLLNHTKHTLKSQWAMGHADEKKKAKSESIKKLERDNIDYDEAANNCVDQDLM